MAGGRIELVALTKRFTDIAVDRIDLTVDSGEFGPVSPADFATTLSALLDGFAIQIALEDPTVDAGRAFELTMRFAARELGFTWVPRHRADGQADAGRRPAGVAQVGNGARADR